MRENLNVKVPDTSSPVAPSTSPFLPAPAKKSIGYLISLQTTFLIVHHVLDRLCQFFSLSATRSFAPRKQRTSSALSKSDSSIRPACIVLDETFSATHPRTIIVNHEPPFSPGCIGWRRLP